MPRLEKPEQSGGQAHLQAPSRVPWRSMRCCLMKDIHSFISFALRQAFEDYRVGQFTVTPRPTAQYDHMTGVACHILVSIAVFIAVQVRSQRCCWPTNGSGPQTQLDGNLYRYFACTFLFVIIILPLQVDIREIGWSPFVLILDNERRK